MAGPFVTATFDVVVVGGGLAGSALGSALAERGIRVLLLEGEHAFKDRVRGEFLAAWGAAEARKLEIVDCLRATEDGHELPYIDFYNGPRFGFRRDIVSTTPHALPCLSFFHPAMQERCLGRAGSTGCVVRRGARATGITAGMSPSVTVDQDGSVMEVKARFVVVADGRVSELRRQLGFVVRRDPEEMFTSGVLLDGSAVPDEACTLVLGPPSGAAYLFPQGRGRVRAYFAYHRLAPYRLSGQRDFSRFVAESQRVGAREEWFTGARPAGPLASFSGADSWVEHPYREGVALLGDAAGSSDPIWGQGMSLALRDARVLRDCLLGSEDWERAGNGYAEQRDQYYGAMHTVTRWLTQLNFEPGDAGDGRRARALPLIAREPDRMPDHLIGGPDLPVSEAVRRRYFGEE